MRACGIVLLLVLVPGLVAEDKKEAKALTPEQRAEKRTQLIY